MFVVGALQMLSLAAPNNSVSDDRNEKIGLTFVALLSGCLSLVGRRSNVVVVLLSDELQMK